MSQVGVSRHGAKQNGSVLKDFFPKGDMLMSSGDESAISRFRRCNWNSAKIWRGSKEVRLGTEYPAEERSQIPDVWIG